MTPFLNEEFLLESALARRLYHEVAKDLPIIDYHCHLPPHDIANDRRFANLHEVWLEGDHYKWRAMRTNGVAEKFCMGDASPYEKFLAWARTVPMTLRNPLYHWTHLELKRYFGIDRLLNETSAPEIWREANVKLDQEDFSVHGILGRMKVEVVCTTDDPCDDLKSHQTIAASTLTTRVFPAFRPDRAMNFSDLRAWNGWRQNLGEVAGCRTENLDEFLEALKKRHAYFHDHGCRLSDHGLNICPSIFIREDVSVVFDKCLKEQPLTAAEAEALAAHLLFNVGKWNHAAGWVMQLHLGALRSVSTRKLKELGRDCGFDSIGDWPQAEKLAHFLDALDCEDQLPKVILYNLNPADNYVFATMIGNFNDGSIPGKIQFGSGWWFLDQKEGMEWQFNALSNLGLFSRFIGMLTDSRSFLSYPRHEYFRRILCQMLGREAERGWLPDDFELLAQYVRGICHQNAQDYFKFPSETKVKK